MRMLRVRFTTWRMVIAITTLAGLGMLGLTIPVFDAAFHGPYSTWYNHHCQRLADQAHLVGRPECEVIKVLGLATHTYEYPEVYPDIGKWTRTYNYAPCPWTPTAKFQVHCELPRSMSVSSWL
jgi:hypothetical protein